MFCIELYPHPAVLCLNLANLSHISTVSLYGEATPLYTTTQTQSVWWNIWAR